MDILVTAANVLYVTAYFTKDMVRLRILTLVAAMCLATYFYNQPVPLLNVVAWNLAFIGINLVHLLKLLLARRQMARGRDGFGAPDGTAA